MNWTLEGELRERAGVADLREAIETLGLLAGDVALVSTEVGDWVRGGAETFICRFVLSTDRGAHVFLLKACVAMGGDGGTAAIASSWVERREHLAEAGLSTPRYYGIHKSTILEEFVPLELRDAISRVRNDGRPATQLAGELGKLAGVLTREGYPALQLSDLRSRGDDVVIVDFGADLGPPRIASREHSAILDQALELLEADGEPVEEELRELVAAFETYSRRD